MSANERLERMLELMGQQRLERRPAAWALPRAALGAMHPAGEDVDRVDRCVVRDLATAAPVGDAANHDGVDVEPEAERNHAATVAPPARCEQDSVPVRYAAEEEGGVSATDGSR